MNSRLLVLMFGIAGLVLWPVTQAQSLVPGDQIGLIPNSSAPIPNIQKFSPTSGTTVTVAAASNYAIFCELSPSTTLATLTVTAPTGDHQGQKLYLTSTNAITILTVNGATGGILGGAASYAINGFSSYFWDGTNWVRCG